MLHTAEEPRAGGGDSALPVHMPPCRHSLCARHSRDLSGTPGRSQSRTWQICLRKSCATSGAGADMPELRVTGRYQLKECAFKLLLQVQNRPYSAALSGQPATQFRFRDVRAC